MGPGIRQIPVALLVFRAIAGPVLIVAAIAGASGVFLAAVLVLAFLSDVFDGIIARRLAVATEGLRSADSIIDTFFYIAAVIALWLHAPNAILANTTGILVIVILESRGRCSSGSSMGAWPRTIIADVEGFVASLILSKWHHDIPHIWRALEIQRAEKGS